MVPFSLAVIAKINGLFTLFFSWYLILHTDGQVDISTHLVVSHCVLLHLQNVWHSEIRWLLESTVVLQNLNLLSFCMPLIFLNPLVMRTWFWAAMSSFFFIKCELSILYLLYTDYFVFFEFIIKLVYPFIYLPFVPFIEPFKVGVWVLW